MFDSLSEEALSDDVRLPFLFELNVIEQCSPEIKARWSVLFLTSPSRHHQITVVENM